jgi:hypothetical protein
LTTSHQGAITASHRNHVMAATFGTNYFFGFPGIGSSPQTDRRTLPVKRSRHRMHKLRGALARDRIVNYQDTLAHHAAS